MQEGRPQCRLRWAAAVNGQGSVCGQHVLFLYLTGGAFGAGGVQNTVLRAAREKQDAEQEIGRLGAEVKNKAAVRHHPPPARRRSST